MFHYTFTCKTCKYNSRQSTTVDLEKAGARIPLCPGCMSKGKRVAVDWKSGQPFEETKPSASQMVPLQGEGGDDDPGNTGPAKDDPE